MAKTKKSDLKPGFPIIYQPGVRETVATAMQKIIKEYERIYRLLNDNIDGNDDQFDQIADDLKDLQKDLQDQINKIINGPTVVDEAKKTSGTLTLEKNGKKLDSFNGSKDVAVDVGLDLSSGIAVTGSSESDWSPTAKAANGSGATLSRIAGIAAGTYTLQNLLQALVTKSHSHGTGAFGNTGNVCNCACDCDCDWGNDSDNN